MKKAFFAIMGTLVLLTGCIGNHEYLDFMHQFDYVIIKLPNGEVVEGDLESWTDYEGEQLQVKVGGKTYVVNSVNCVLIRYADTGIK